jgi:hypothetical protein
MSEIRVTSIVGENGGDRVGLTTGLTVGPLTGTTGIGATITHHGHAQFAGVCTATSFSGDGSNLSGVSAGKLLQIKENYSTTTTSTTSTSYADITGTSITMTPTSATSTLIITFTANSSRVGHSGGGTALLAVRLLEDSTVLQTADEFVIGAVGNGEMDYIGGARIFRYSKTAGSGSRTYKMQIARLNGNQTGYVSNGVHMSIMEVST